MSATPDEDWDPSTDFEPEEEASTFAPPELADELGHDPRRDRELEQHVLGAVMLDSRCWATVSASLRASDFESPEHQVIFRAMESLYEREEPLDLLALSAELRTMRRFNTVGGAQYLEELTDRTPTSAHLEMHCRSLAMLSAARQARRAALKVLYRYRDLGNRPEQIVEEATSAMGAISLPTTSKLVSLSDSLTLYLEHFAEKANGKKKGVATGFKDLDALTTGPGPGQLWIVAGRPAMGKTSVAQKLARSIAEVGPVLFASMEMPHAELSERLLADASGVPNDLLRRQTITDEHWARVLGQLPMLSTLPLFYLDAADLKLSELRVHARALKAKHGLAAVVLDYLQLLEADREFDSRTNEVSYLSRGLKKIAKELEVPVIALSQLSRKCEERQDKRPMMSDLRESGAIEQDADVVMFIYRDEVYDKNTEHRGITELIVAKQRQGATDTVYVGFQKHLSRLTDLTPQQRERVYKGNLPEFLRGQTGESPPPAEPPFGDSF